MIIRMPDDMEAAVSKAAESRGQDAGDLVERVMSEFLKTDVVPGIVFADGPSGRRARIEGTGIDVFEVVQAYLAEQGNREQLGSAFHWLDDRQIDTALTYYRRFPDDVTPFLMRMDAESGANIEGSQQLDGGDS